MSFFTPRSSKQKRAVRIQLAALTVALLLALVALPASASHEEEVEYISAYEEAQAAKSAGSSEADSARLAALGEYHTAKSLEASHAAASTRYSQLAAFHAGDADSNFVAENPETKYASDWDGASAAATNADFLAANPEIKYASDWVGASAGAAAKSGSNSNPELSAFQRYCSC